MIESGETIPGGNGEKKERRKSLPEVPLPADTSKSATAAIALTPCSLPGPPPSQRASGSPLWGPGTLILTPQHWHAPHSKLGCLFKGEKDSRMPLLSKSTRLLRLLCHNWSSKQLKIVSKRWVQVPLGEISCGSPFPVALILSSQLEAKLNYLPQT